MNKTFYVLSHTHWDREWYQPFEQFRLRLCDLINHLFEIIEEYPDYIFHLDAQTIVLEDYTEMYPENREKLEKYIKSGNIIVGPWYVQNDFFLTSGESTIRNVLIGTEIAEKYGKCANVGYTPDQFGLISQLPQIFSGLGIRYHLFGRGWAFFAPNSTTQRVPCDIDFYWEGPDGSRVFSVNMPYWYNNAQRYSPDIDKSVERVKKAEKEFEPWSKSPFLLMMNGVDHLEAQDDLLPILKKINEKLDGITLIQADMESAVKAIEPYARENPVKGELRNGCETDLLTGTFSTRVEIKKKNYDAQNLIEKKVEPLYAMLMMAGMDNYPSHEIRYMWKSLIPNHAHDSICCCSHPNVMKHMEDRILRVNEVGDTLIEKGTRFINQHIERNENGNGVYYLTVINTAQTDFSGTMELSIDLHANDAAEDFRIFAPDGREIDYVLLSKTRTTHAAFSALNLPGNVDVVNYNIRVYVEGVPAYGYKNYTVKAGGEHINAKAGQLLENEYLKAEIDEVGRIDITDKTKNNRYCDVLAFEDVGDAGDSYTFRKMNDVPVKAVFTGYEREHADALSSAVKLKYTLPVPCGKDENGRAGETVDIKLTVRVSLAKGDRALTFDTEIDNPACFHLLRAVIRTGVNSKISYASSVFDVIERDSGTVRPDIRNYTQPVNGYVYKQENGKGIAVFTKGLYEYDNEVDSELRLSLLRSTLEICTGCDNDPRRWNTPDNLMLGKTNVTFAIMPYTENLHAFQQHIDYKPLYAFDSTDIRMFTGGRPAVQDTAVPELYFRKDEYESLVLPQEKRFVSVSSKVCVSALKKAENGNKAVLRFFNPSDFKVDEAVNIDASMVKTDLKEKCEKEFDNTAAPKEIVTLLIG